MDPDLGRAIQVRSIAEEYQHLHRQRCPCAGHYQLVHQALVQDALGRPHDLLHCRCTACGATYTFVFDVSSFYGR
jgi:hypothetical protein